jgi:alpha-ketoglutarate-dependent 2,4-dichlorophenoxyacetate dioxygenase
MAWRERKLTDRVGVELSGQTIGSDLSADDRRQIYRATEIHGVTLIRDQQLDDRALYEFLATLGDTVVQPPAMEGVEDYARGVIPIGNVDKDGNLLPADDWNVQQNLANELWHTDMTFLTPRATVSLLYAKVVPPEEGNTEFCDTRLFWDVLGEDEREYLRGLTCHHSVFHSRKRYGFTNWPESGRELYPSIRRPLVHVQQSTGRTALTLAAYIESIEGMTEAESDALVDDLTARATVPENVYSHRWRPDDLVLWDTRCMMHRARPFDMTRYPRDMRGMRLCDPALA